MGKKNDPGFPLNRLHQPQCERQRSSVGCTHWWVTLRMQLSCLDGTKRIDNNALLWHELALIPPRWGDTHRHLGGIVSTTELNIDL